jgi:nucleotide-binding universal stress UspA family protein
MTQYRIGIDETVGSQAALAWVDADVRSGLDRVVIMTGVRSTPGGDGATVDLLSATRERLHQRHPHLVVTEDGPDTADRAATAGDAEVLVIGVKRASPSARAFSGWVPERITTNSTIPVVAVPEQWEESPGCIVVGVDADTSSAALEFAAARALAAGCELVVVRAWQVPTVTTPYGYAYVEEDRGIWARQAEELVDHFARVAAGRFPGLRIRTAVTEGRAADVMGGLSASASLLVVGRRHRTLLGGALFGSIGRQLLHESGVPVATVPPDVSEHRRPDTQVDAATLTAAGTR